MSLNQLLGVSILIHHFIKYCICKLIYFPYSAACFYHTYLMPKHNQVIFPFKIYKSTRSRLILFNASFQFLISSFQLEICAVKVIVSLHRANYDGVNCLGCGLILAFLVGKRDYCLCFQVTLI